MQRTLLDFAKKRPRSPSPPTVVTVDVESSIKQVKSHSWSGSLNSSPLHESLERTTVQDDEGLASLIVNPIWREFLYPLTSCENFSRIEQFIEEEIAGGKTVLPPRSLIFSAFNSTPFDRLKVVLLGQDPYHNIGQAHGLCFSVRPGVRPPPSLVNMYKELTTDIPGFKTPSHGYLQLWAEQGVLMLNATLTVEAHKANSHAACGWQTFTDGVIRLLSEKYDKPLVFLLWGGFARKKVALINRKRHVVVECAHPSPLSVTKWLGSRPFSKCNAALTNVGHEPIDWSLPLTTSMKA